GPLGELHLDDDFRLYPVRAFVGSRCVGEWRLTPLESMQSLVHVREALAIEAAACVPDILQLAIPIEVAEQDRAEIRAGASRLVRPAARRRGPPRPSGGDGLGAPGGGRGDCAPARRLRRRGCTVARAAGRACLTLPSLRGTASPCPCRCASAAECARE